MNPAWQLAATHTFNLGWDQMILLESHPGTHFKLIYGDVCLTGDCDGREDATILAF